MMRFAFVLGTLLLAGCASTRPAQVAGDPPEEEVPQYPDDLVKEDLVLGTGDEANFGRTVDVHYTGWLTNGTSFDTSTGRGPLSVKLGAGQVIRGWERGLIGMKVGGKRKLTIPPKLAYGSREMGNIPPNSTLIFEVELMAVR